MIRAPDGDDDKRSLGRRDSTSDGDLRRLPGHLQLHPEQFAQFPRLLLGVEPGHADLTGIPGPQSADHLHDRGLPGPRMPNTSPCWTMRLIPRTTTRPVRSVLAVAQPVLGPLAAPPSTRR